MASWFDSFIPVTGLMGSIKNAGGQGLGKIIGGITDSLGITDTGAQQRGLEELKKGMGSANADLDKQMQGVFDMYGSAMAGRQMGDVLNQYRDSMKGTEDAGGAANVEQFMNPMYGRAMDNAANQALAGAGSSALSTAGTNAVSTGVGNTAQSMWQQAFNNAMADAQNKQGVYGAIEQSDMMPSLNWAQLTSDVAGSKYDAAASLANSAAQTAGQNQGWFSSLFNGVLG